jgi:hypothetical protein
VGGSGIGGRGPSCGGLTKGGLTIGGVKLGGVTVGTEASFSSSYVLVGKNVNWDQSISSYSLPRSFRGYYSGSSTSLF